LRTSIFNGLLVDEPDEDFDILTACSFKKKKEAVDLPDEDFDILTAFSCMLEELDVLDDLTGTSV
jgi:hypothetical protein